MNFFLLFRYEFSLGCKLTRASATLSSSSNWTIKAAMDRTGDVFDQSNNFTFPTSLDIYLDSARTYESKQNTTFSVKQVPYRKKFRRTKVCRKSDLLPKILSAEIFCQLKFEIFRIYIELLKNIFSCKVNGLIRNCRTKLPKSRVGAENFNLFLLFLTLLESEFFLGPGVSH